MDSTSLNHPNLISAKLEKYFQKANPGAPFGTATGNGATPLDQSQPQQQFMPSQIVAGGAPENNGGGNGGNATANNNNNFENGPPIY
jgi:hypothetical protein